MQGPLFGRCLGQALWTRLRELPNLTICCPATVTATDLQEGAGNRRISLQTEDGEQTLETRLLVVADGARSKVRAALGIDAEERNYEQVAVVGGTSGRSRTVGESRGHRSKHRNNKPIRQCRTAKNCSLAVDHRCRG